LSAASYLLFRRGGGLWGVASDEVVRVAPHAAGLAVEAGATAFAADEVVGVVAGLAVRPLPLFVRRFWSEPGAGLALHAGEPLMIVDPRQPPPPFLSPPEASGGTPDV